MNNEINEVPSHLLIIFRPIRNDDLFGVVFEHGRIEITPVKEPPFPGRPIYDIGDVAHVFGRIDRTITSLMETARHNAYL